jgi:hypothetical protein
VETWIEHPLEERGLARKIVIEKVEEFSVMLELPSFVAFD